MRLWSASFFLVTNVGASAKAPVTADVPSCNAVLRMDLKLLQKSADASGVVVWLCRWTNSRRRQPTGLKKLPKSSSTTRVSSRMFSRYRWAPKSAFPTWTRSFTTSFSLFDGKRFDLGLYEAGTTRTVRFDRAGVSFLFCNIHPEMSAVVVAVETPYFGTSSRSGHVAISDVPDGRYQLNVWYERSMVEDLKALSRPVRIFAAERSLDHIRVIENPNFSPAHKNKYGQDYVAPPRSGYVRP